MRFLEDLLGFGDVLWIVGSTTLPGRLIIENSNWYHQLCTKTPVVQYLGPQY